jgi:glyoxylase-like metal-dependent hydrolase (beta-lactamase superfamily II)
MTSPAGSDTYEVLALKYAELASFRRGDCFIGADDHDRPNPIDYFVWAIRNRDRTIVVDTGFDAVEGAKRGRKVVRAPAAALEHVGISAGQVDQVVVTHLHYDHAGTLSAFPKARFHLQAAEMAFATGPSMCHAHMRHPFTVDHICEMVKNVYAGRVIFHDGDAEIAPGVTVHRIGGHSRGLQCVRVATASGPVVLASDASHFYENFETSRVFPVTVDVAEVLAGYQRLIALAGSARRIVPGHDPLVLRRYPALNGATEGIVHRVDVARLD